MKINLYSKNINLLSVWRSKLEDYDLHELHDFSTKDEMTICDFDTIAHEFNEHIIANTLPQKLIVLESDPQIITGKQLIHKGVKAYANSALSKANFIQMIESVHTHHTWTYPQLTEALIQQTTTFKISQEGKSLLKRLSAKEIEVIKHLLEGHSNIAISEDLKITVRTVKSHLSNIFNKLHINDRISLVLLLKG